VNPRYLTLRQAGSLYILLDACDVLLHEHGDAFVEITSFRSDQLVLEVLADACYRLASIHGRFRGEIWNTVMPLVPEDFWLESPDAGIRTWRRDGNAFNFFPYTLADVRAVTRCGRPEGVIKFDEGSCIVRLSHGGEGIAFIDLPLSRDETVFRVLEKTKVSIIRDFEPLRQYIAADGTLTY
jgi:hypothetical protein